MTNTYQIREDSGASEIIEAESLEHALEWARDWASQGSYDERVMVTVYVHELDPETYQPYDGWYGDGRNATDAVAAGPEPKPSETDCGTDDEDHDWQSPEWLGGCRENPGVWSTGGTSMRFLWVCAGCGIYKTTDTSGPQRNPGQLDEKTEYSEADERSLAWIAEINDGEPNS